MFGDFKILVLIHDGESKSYLARHPSFDRTVMLHVLPRAESAEYAAVAGYWDRLPQDSRKLILDRGVYEGTSYFVTERILDFRSLPAWLDKVAPRAGVPAPAPAPAPVSAPAPAQPSPPGEFTRMFQAAPIATPSVPAPPPASPVSPAAPGGEFTRMFSGAGTGTRPTADLPIPSETKKPGAFTKAFLALSDTGQQPGMPPGPFPQPAAAPSKPGEFTALFSSPLPPAPGPLATARPVPHPESVPAKPAAQPVGEFTKMFGTPLPSSPGADSQAEAESTNAPPPPAPAAPAPAAPAAKPADAVKAGPSNTILIVVGVVLLLLAVALVAFFALRH